MSSDAGEVAFSELENLPIEIREPVELYRVAWELAKRFDRSTIYDCCYLALAELHRCELWTADQRLINADGSQLPWLHTLL